MIYTVYGRQSHFEINQDLPASFKRKKLADVVSIKNTTLTNACRRGIYDFYNVIEYDLDDDSLSFNNDREHHFRKLRYRAKPIVEFQELFSSPYHLFAVYPLTIFLYSDNSEKDTHKKKRLIGKVKRCSLL